MGPAGKRSVGQLIRGSIAPVLWVGVVLAGIVIPWIIFMYNYVAGVSLSSGSMVAAVSGILIGLFSFDYCVLKGALYSPLIPS